MRYYYETTAEHPGVAPSEYTALKWPKEDPPARYNGLKPVFGNTRVTRRVPESHVPSFQPRDVTIEPRPEWWEVPRQSVFPDQPKPQNVTWLCEQADELLHPAKAAWIRSQLENGWDTLCRAPTHRRINRRAALVTGTSHANAWTRIIAWAKAKNLCYSNVLPVIPGTQTYLPSAALKISYTWNDPDDPTSRNWKMRGVMQGGESAHKDGSSRAHWTHNIDVAFSQQHLREAESFIVKHQVKSVLITDYEKFFCQLMRAPNEIASNCIWHQGEFHWFACNLFGEKSVPHAAHEYAHLLQLITHREICKRTVHPVLIVRRTDDQLILPSNPDDVPLANLVVKSVCRKAGAWMQHTKTRTGVPQYDLMAEHGILNVDQMVRWACHQTRPNI